MLLLRATSLPHAIRTPASMFTRNYSKRLSWILELMAVVTTRTTRVNGALLDAVTTRAMMAVLPATVVMPPVFAPSVILPHVRLNTFSHNVL